MDDGTRTQIERACERLVITYTHLVDFGGAEKIADLFTEDGEFVGGGANHMKGREQLKRGFGRRQKSKRISRHVCTNLQIDVIDDDNAKGLVYLSLYRHDPKEGVGPDPEKGPPDPEKGPPDPVKGPAPLPGPNLIGQYEDIFQRVDGQWLFAQRKIGVAFLSEREPKS